MLVYIGLGLYDERDMSLRGLEEARTCETLFAEFYTSILAGTTIKRLEEAIGKTIKVLSRSDVESSDQILEEAENKKVGFLVPGDPLISTTHISLRLEAKKRGIKTKVIHNTSISSAAPAISGLFNYKFGASASIPFPEKGYMPESFYETIKENLERGLHTLLYLDIKERLMSVGEALKILLEVENRRGETVLAKDTLVVGIGCAGSDEPVVSAGRVGTMIQRDMGPLPHILIVPGKLHFIEEEYLKEFAGRDEL